MLMSAILTLRPVEEGQLSGPTGRQAQAWFLAQVAAHAPALATELHASSALRPYTVSGLMRPPWKGVGPGERLTPDDWLLLRLTTMTPALSDCWLNGILPALPERLALRGLALECEGWTCEAQQHPWAALASFGSLVQQTGAARSRRVTLAFASPTAFRLQGRDIPLPVPASILRSWWRKWNAFAPEALQINPAWPPFAEACVQVAALSGLHTARWRFANGQRGGALGYMGRVGLLLASRKQSATWATVWPGAKQTLHTLSAFALFCGTGHHATVGMGQTRVVDGV